MLAGKKQSSMSSNERLREFAAGPWGGLLFSAIVALVVVGAVWVAASPPWYLLMMAGILVFGIAEVGVEVSRS